MSVAAVIAIVVAVIVIIYAYLKHRWMLFGLVITSGVLNGYVNFVFDFLCSIGLTVHALWFKVAFYAIFIFFAVGSLVSVFGSILSSLIHT